jgi:hypothetical protein
VNLSIKGNFFDKHPDIRNLVLHYFPNLTELDNQQVSRGMRNVMSAAMYLRKMLIPLRYKLEKAKIVAEENLKAAQAEVNSRKSNRSKFEEM